MRVIVVILLFIALATGEAVKLQRYVLLATSLVIITIDLTIFFFT